MNRQRKQGMSHLLAACLIALGLFWPSVQAAAASNDQLSWLICSPNQNVTLSPAEQKQLQVLGRILGSDQTDKTETTHTCPYQGCFGSHGANALVDAPPSFVPVRAWTQPDGLLQITGIIRGPLSKHVIQSPRAPPIGFQLISI